MEKNKKGLIAVLIVIIVLLLCALGYLLFGKDLLNKKENNAVIQPEVVTEITTEELYKTYLANLKKEITTKYDEYNNNVVSGKSRYLDTTYDFTIKKNLDLVFTTDDKKYNNYKVSENVLNMFLIDAGNGGYTLLYYIKTDGSLNKMCIDCLAEEEKVKVEQVDKKYIVNVTQGLFDYEFSGSPEPIFIDIKGNMFID